MALIGCALPTLAKGAVTVRVDMSSQTMRVDATTGEFYVWKISTGRVGYRTPNGTYRPQRLEKFWRSRKYGMAPMPHSIFFHAGYAIHGTNEVSRLGRTASHGCIRLAPGNAAALFGLVQRHSMAATRIVITGAPRENAGARAPRLRDEPRSAPNRRPVRVLPLYEDDDEYGPEPLPQPGSGYYYYYGR
jgi:hypothetical protein